MSAHASHETHDVHEEMPEGHLHWTQDEYNHGLKESVKTILILSAVTIIEVGTAMTYDIIDPDGSGIGKLFINLFMAVASVVKVYFIMGTFMHLKNETKGFIATALVPFSLLIWAIIAFSYEGASVHHMRSLLNIF